MLFKYKTLTKEGEVKEGTVDALTEEAVIRSLQQRGLTIVSLASTEGRSFFSKKIFFSRHVPVRELVILSRQVATLFSAHVSVLRSFRMLSEEADNVLLKQTLAQVASDIQGGAPIAAALEKHPLIFSDFYTNMVRAGEESGKLDEVFEYLADYLSRSYELLIKARNAFLYPIFVIGVFIIVMVLLLTVIFPKLSEILTEVGQDIPIYTRIVMGVSEFLVNYGVFFLALLIVGGFMFYRFAQTKNGKMYVSQVELDMPIIGGLAKKFYLSRVADNMSTLLAGGLPLLKTLEITAAVVGDATYESILLEAAQDVRGGSLVSESFMKHKEIPGIMLQIIKAGEETGQLGTILKTLADFYRREVYNAVDGLVGLIEPVLIVALGLGVGIIVASVLLPIYNISTGF